jgi:hypothetical protein
MVFQVIMLSQLPFISLMLPGPQSHKFVHMHWLYTTKWLPWKKLNSYKQITWSVTNACGVNSNYIAFSLSAYTYVLMSSSLWSTFTFHTLKTCAKLLSVNLYNPFSTPYGIQHNTASIQGNYLQKNKCEIWQCAYACATTSVTMFLIVLKQLASQKNGMDFRNHCNYKLQNSKN